MESVRSRIPGILLVVVVAAISWAISRSVTWLPAAPLALVLGWAAAFLVGARLATDPGVSWSGTRPLRLGVMLLGAQLSLGEIVARGAEAIPLILVALIVVFGAALLIGRLFAIPSELRLLMGAGIGICGNSAIAAVAPIARASQQQVATAVATITVFGTAAVLVYPVVGAALGLSSGDYGVWSGIAIADTAQVVAAGFAAGSEAGEVATITKLTRNAFLGPVVLLIAAQAARSARAEAVAPIGLFTAIPPFVLGFLALAALRSLGVIGEALGDVLALVGGFAILVGLAGIGYGLRTTRPGRSDFRALGLGFAIMAAVSVITLIAVIAT
jgi:uncharacterized integral membrane protein (TIGR00698 family)